MFLFSKNALAKFLTGLLVISICLSFRNIISNLSNNATGYGIRISTIGGVILDEVVIAYHFSVKNIPGKTTM